MRTIVIKHFLIIAILVSSTSSFAQLNKFNGSFVSKDIQMCIEQGKNGETIEYPMFERATYYRFDIDDQNNVDIRLKMEFIDINSREKSTHYFTVKDIIVKEDYSISCSIYNPPEMGKTYIEKITPIGHVYYDKLVEHRVHVFTISNNILHVRIGKTIREFYKNGRVIETDECSDCTEYVFDCYNEQDNW